MSNASRLHRKAESLYADLTAPTWHFWRDKDRAAPRLAGMGHTGRAVMVKLARLVVHDPRFPVRLGAAYAVASMLLPYSMEGKDAKSWAEADAQIRKIRKDTEDAYAAPTAS